MGVVGAAASTVRHGANARRAPERVEARDDAEAQQHPLHRLQILEGRLRQADTDALALTSLHAAVGVEQAAQEAPVALGGSTLDRLRHRLGARRHTETQGERLDGGRRHPPLAALGDLHPAGKVAAMAERPHRALRLDHDGEHAGSLEPAVDDGPARPCAQDSLVRLQRSVTQQQAEQITLLEGPRPVPRHGLAVIVQHDLVALAQLAGGDPVALRAPARTLGHPADPVVSGQAQRDPLRRAEPVHRFHAGGEEALPGAGVRNPVDQGGERPTDEIADQSGAVGGVNPCIAGNAGIGRGDGLAIPEVIAAIDPVDEDHAGLGDVVGGGHDPIPKRARLQGPEHGAVERQVPVGVGLDRRHERVGDQDREVEHPQPRRIALGFHEILDVGMVAAQRRHHGTAP